MEEGHLQGKQMSRVPPNPDLVKIIEPIVKGHTKAFVYKLHPGWFPKRFRSQIVTSLVKRIINDLCCEMNYERITSSVVVAAATVGQASENLPQDAVQEGAPNSSIVTKHQLVTSHCQMTRSASYVSTPSEDV